MTLCRQRHRQPYALLQRSYQRPRLTNDLGGQRSEDSPFDNDSGDLRSQITDEDRLDVATQNRLMLEMLLENQAQWKAEQRLERERMAAERDRMAAERDHWAA